MKRVRSPARETEYQRQTALRETQKLEEGAILWL